VPCGALVLCRKDPENVLYWTGEVFENFLNSITKDWQPCLYLLSVFADSDLLKHMESTDSAWHTSQSCRPIGYNVDIIATSGNSYSASRQDIDPSCYQPSQGGCCSSPSAQHLYQHSLSYPPHTG